ncbi:hypothetical protein [Streptomyces albidoflavus]|uniref:hypothetical protein n=1 Tax=Streptomyces albidoflavus TaxID=1886 RepID=UPI00101F42F8|nr:hypothetical protein [Streptomyces albidoflavus]RZF02961.1 hypothetical protein C0R05_32660 [Streptomyces albidoflavus]
MPLRHGDLPERGAHGPTPDLALPAYLDNENEQARAVYARYGAATYAASLLEVEFIHVLATIEQQRAAASGRPLRQDPWEKRYANGTMGTFLDALKGKKLLDSLPGLAADLAAAVEVRNHLVHHYWWQEFGEAFSSVGRAKMVSHLEEQRAFFDRLTTRVREGITLPLNPPAGTHRQLPCEDEQTREMYGRFGVAVYFADVLASGLVCVLAAAEVERAQAGRYRIDDPWDRMYADRKLTMGALLNQVKEGGHLAAHQDLIGPLDAALASRNELAHHFWVSRIEDSFSEAGRDRLVEDLEQRRQTFEDVNNAVQERIAAPLVETLGVSREQTEGIERAMRFREENKYR